MYKKYLIRFLIIIAFTICIYIILATNVPSYLQTIIIVPKDLPTRNVSRDVQYTALKQSGENDNTKNYIGEVYSLDGNVPSKKINITNQNTNTLQTNASYWDWVDSIVSSYGMYRETDDVERILETMRTSTVTSFTRFKGGSSLKFWVVLSGGQPCIFKPYLDPEKLRGRWEDPHFEIATFHIDRLLGMRKVPYATGRVLNFQTEILPVANESAKDLFSTHANGSVCLRKRWRSFCYDDGVPGALIYFVRRELKVEWGRFHPLHPTGSLHRMVHRKNKTLCAAVMTLIPHPAHSIYMDLHDLNILDYLILNLDRQYFHVVQSLSQQHVVTLHLDHGLARMCGTCTTITMERYLLSALRQCCRIRRATYDRLVDIYKLGDSFAEKFAQLTRTDPLSPLVNRTWMTKMVERIGHVIDVVNRTCRPRVTDSELFV